MSTKTLELKKVTLKPIGDRVVIRRLPVEEVTRGGIIIPDTAKEKPQQGEVIAVGPGKKDYNMIVKKGDRVLFGKYSGQEFELNGEELLVMREDDILAILN
jgi:chaperonin GroES